MNFVLVSWFLVFLVLGFLDCEVYCFLGSLVSKFLGFKVSKIYLTFRWEKLAPHYQIFVSCFMIDIGPISKILMNSLDGSTGLFGARRFQNDLFPKSNIVRFPKLISFKSDVGSFLAFFEVSWGLQR